MACPAWAQEEEQESSGRQIVVIGQRPESTFGVIPDAELNENDIAAYGVNSVGELIDEVYQDVDGSGEGPVVLINGELTNGINDVADLPAEAATRIEVLPSTVAARFGQSPTRPVINVVINPNLLQVTTRAEAGWSTHGDAFAGEAELNFLKLQNNNRRSLVLRVVSRDPLFEADRDIIPDDSGTPFDLIGNVVSYPSSGGEIDPALSLLAGTPATVAGVPGGVASPTLSQFAANANVRNLSEMGLYRTLLGKSVTYSANSNVTQRFSPVTSLSVTARAQLTDGSGLTGASGALLRVPVGTPFSPFSRDVSVARWLGVPLEQESRATTLTFSGILNAQAGNLRISVSGSYNHGESKTLSDRDYGLASLQSGIAAGTVNPFAAIETDLLGPVWRDRADSNTDDANAQVVAAAPLFRLPAGDVRVTAQLGWRFNSLSASSVGSAFNASRQFSRTEESGQLNFQIPLMSGETGPIGDLSLDLTGEVHRADAAGTLSNWGVAVNWLPVPAANLRTSVTQEELAPTAAALTDAIVVIDSFRTYDFVRQETVLVRYITGGNPALPVQGDRVFIIGAVVTPFSGIDLRLSATYENRVTRNALASLPPVNADVQLAFADRYLRDANGVLIQLDARPVTYERDEREQIRWNIDFKETFGSRGLIAGASPGDVDAGSGWRVNLGLDHVWTLQNTRLARTGLPVIDLLDGGAIGYGGGQPEHVVIATANVAHRGFGAQFDAAWRSATSIRAGTVASPSDVTFAPRLLVNARLFANLGPQFPGASWAKGARIELTIRNLFDSKQRVTDSIGSTPLRYQPFLIDPLGRSFAVAFRKAF